MSKNCSILVVEDNEIIRESVCVYLESEGFDVTCCENGFTALDSVRARSYKVVITDHGLPGMNGAEIVRSVRTQFPSTFIIGVSGGSKEKDFLDAGADVYLQKPYPFSRLAELVRESCRCGTENSDFKENVKEHGLADDPAFPRF